MLRLRREPGVEADAPRLRFQKPGPDTGRERHGLPPSPQGSPDPAPSPAPPPGAPSAASVPIPEEAPSLSLAAPQGEAPSPSGPANPFTSSLDDLARYLPRGAPGGGGYGTASSSAPQLSGDASFAFDSGGFDLSEWAELVKLRVRSNWIIPTAARMGMKGIVSVDLVVERDGTISFCEESSTCGVISMDSAALNAVRSSNPLPPLPRGFPKENLPARFTFYYNTEVR